MKKIFLIICMTTVVLGFSSCDRLKHFGEKTSTNSTTECADSDDSTNKSASKTDTTKKNTEPKNFDTVKKTIDSLQSDLMKYNSDIDSLKSDINAISDTSQKKIDSKSAYTFMIVEAIVFLCFLVYLLYRIHKLNESQEHHQNNIKKIDSEIKTNTNSNTLVFSNIQRSVKNLESRISTLENKSKNYSGYASATGSQSSIQSTNHQVQRRDVQQQPTNTKVFYMPRSAKPNQFDDKRKSYTPSESSYFKFTIISQSEAEFEFYGGEDARKVRDSFNDRNDSIATVCEIIETVSDPQRCETRSKGMARLVNGIWYVNSKAKIAYV